MAQVPYSPVPSTTPTTVGLPRIGVNAPEAAFGGAVAQATTHLGQALDQSGNELFARAYALKQLDNEATSRELEMGAGQQLGQLRDQYITQKGKNAVDALPAYQQGVAKVRSDALASAPNLMVRRDLDNNLSNRIVRDLDFAGQHSATEFLSWQKSTNAATHATIMDQVMSHPDDPKLFEDGMRRAGELAVQAAGLEGNTPDDEATKLGVKKAQSEIWASKVTGLARRDPAKAKEFMEAGLDKGFLTGQDYYKLQNPVDTMLHSVVSRNVSDAVNRGWGAYMTPEQQSRANGVEPALVDTIKRAQMNHPELQFGIGPQGGYRTQADQDKLYAQGRTAPGPVVTWTRQSQHMTGRAVDVVPFNKSTNQDQVNAAMQEAAQQLGVKFAATPQLAAKGDLDHFQLADDFNIAGYKSPDPSTLEDRQRAAQQFVEDKYGDPKMTFATRDRVRSDFDLQQTNQRHQNQQDYLTLANFVYDNKITNPDVILNSPNLFSVYNRLEAPMKKRVDNLVTALAKAPTTETPEKAVATQKILNMSTNLGGMQDAFMKIDPTELLDKGVVSTTGMTKIFERQRAIMQQKYHDHDRLESAMRIAKPLLDSMGITKDMQTDTGDDLYTQSYGAMNDFLQRKQVEGKPATDTEIQEHAREMIHNFGGFFSPSYGFQRPSPGFIEEFTKLYRAQPGNTAHRAPAPDELNRAWLYAIKNPNWRSEIGK